MAPTRKEILTSTKAFCEAFAEKRDVETILSFFSTTFEISVIEYGDPMLAPFLGRNFIGQTEMRNYFKLIGSLLTYENITFSEYIVDLESLKVAAKGTGTFTWLSTNQSWKETFAYALDFDDELKIVRYQVWADSGAAYLASIGKLAEVKAL